MQVVVLCGGTGTRLQEVTELTPKPLIPIGGKPLVWHIMRHYMRYGFNNFVLALGYKQEAFKKFFLEYEQNNSHVWIRNGTPFFAYPEDDFMSQIEHLTLVDTGPTTLKGERLRLVKAYCHDTFMLTYGDGLSDVNLTKLLDFHKNHGKIGTITGIQAHSKFGDITYDPTTDRINSFREKPQDVTHLTNGGFMVFNKEFFEYLSPGCDLESIPLGRLAADGELCVFKHTGFWHCVDTMKDVGDIRRMWEEGNTPWLK